MKKINLLEQFYNEKFYVENMEMEQFSELEEWQKEAIRNTFLFDVYRFRNAMKILKNEFNLTFLIAWLIIGSIAVALAYVFAVGMFTIFK